MRAGKRSRDTVLPDKWPAGLQVRVPHTHLDMLVLLLGCSAEDAMIQIP